MMGYPELRPAKLLYEAIRSAESPSAPGAMRKVGKPSKPTYQLTSDQIDGIRRDARAEADKAYRAELKKVTKQIRKDALDEAVKFTLAIPVLVLSDKFGFTQEQMDLFFIGIRSWIQACFDDPDALSEVVSEVKEMGYEIEWR